jgi:ferrous iron transport protein A
VTSTVPAKRARPQPISKTAPSTALGSLRVGAQGVVLKVGAEAQLRGVDPGELERRLLEMGFVEGARFELLHEGLIGRDPIAVRIEDLTVALRRREASAVLVSLIDDGAALAEAAE